MKTDDLTSPFLPLHPIVAVAAMNLFLLILLILMFCSSLAKPAGFEIRMPKALVSEGLQGDQNIVVTAENVLYFNNKVVTLTELKKNLVKTDIKHQNIFIRVDRRSSMGRVMDVWDLCRALGGSHVHIMAAGES
ncbi:MAG: biopolymer transporter ExbD [Candidatus Omnitrophota bacterium]